MEIPWKSMETSWASHGNHGNPIKTLWKFYRNPMEIPSKSHGNPMDIPSESHGNPIRIPWELHGNPTKSHQNPMEIPSKYHGNSIKIPLKSHQNPMKTSWKSHGNFMEISWKFHGFFVFLGDIPCKPWKPHQNFLPNPMEIPTKPHGNPSPGSPLESPGALVPGSTSPRSCRCACAAKP